MKKQHSERLSRIIESLAEFLKESFKNISLLVGCIGLLCAIASLFAIAAAYPPAILLIIVAGPFNLLLSAVFMIMYGFQLMGAVGLLVAGYLIGCTFYLIKDVPLNS
ncbi:MAG: hypothetical protein HC888_05585 [Candidatus Competibacteraceae bacterium]|nr:hypothetical protein [Candidatus Competibacteraceae bacterium]